MKKIILAASVLFALTVNASAYTGWVCFTNFASFTKATPDCFIGTNPQTGTTYTIAAGDMGSLTTFNNASSIAVTLPQAQNATPTSGYATSGVASFSNGWWAIYENLGAGTVTITPTTSTINGAATYVLRTGQSILLTAASVTGQCTTPSNGCWQAQIMNPGDTTVSSTVLVGSAVALTTGTPANITSISVPPGTWDINFLGSFTGAAGTSVNYMAVSVSATSATMDTTPGSYGAQSGGVATIFNLGWSGGMTETAGPVRVTVTAATTYYAVAQAGFTASTMSGYGILLAKRVK